MDADEKAVTFAQETTKQFIALASGIPAIMITFSKDFLAGVPENVKSIALWSWGTFVVSVFFGLLTLMALTGALVMRARKTAAAASSAQSEPAAAAASPAPKPANVDETLPIAAMPNVRLFAALQILTFFVGLLLVVWFGWAGAEFAVPKASIDT